MSEKKEIEILKFDAINIPKPYESPEKNNEKYVQYGIDNLYPNFLLKLYNESPIHSSIINSKANYILGDGVQYSSGTKIEVKVNASDTFEEFSRKVIIDFLIFNYFCVEVVYNKFNQPIEYHFIPAHKIRTNKDKTKFWYFEDIINNGRRYITFERYKTKSLDSTSKIFFFDGYFPSLSNVYPIPEYNGSIISVQNDIEIRNFNLNNIKNHFSVSTLITFFMGSNPSEDVKRRINNDLKASYTGASGKKLIVDYQHSEGKAADVKNISPNDWDKAYEAVSRSVADDIYRGHQVTSPMLFGVKTEGQLGGATELETAYEIFKNTYIRNRRNELQNAFNLLFSDSELIKGQLAFADKQLFAARISETLKEKVYTINEIRKEAGLPPLPDGDRLLGNTTQPQPFYQVPSPQADEPFHLKEEDFEKVKDMGISVEEFDVIEEGEFVTSKEDFSRIELQFEQDEEIAKYIIDNDIKGMSIKDLKAVLRRELGIDITVADLNKTLKNLSKSGVANVAVEDGTINVTPAEESQPKSKIEVMYTYEVRRGMGAPIIESTRPFCRRLMENNRLYTRQEIQTMTSIFGYDIFEYGGGFYKNPRTGKLTSHCRHQFKSRKVSRKTKKY